MPNYSSSTQALVDKLMTKHNVPKALQKQMKESLSSGTSLPYEQVKPPPANNSSNNPFGTKSYRYLSKRPSYMIQQQSTEVVKPAPGVDRSRLTLHLQEKMSGEQHKSTSKPIPSITSTSDLDLFTELYSEIQERLEFFDALDPVGKGQNRHRLMVEISDRLRQMKREDSERFKILPARFLSFK
ncbi:hypothetical protein GEMRC1_006425 [Eukaryota sp. GEM-RC1]